MYGVCGSLCCSHPGCWNEVRKAYSGIFTQFISTKSTKYIPQLISVDSKSHPNLCNEINGSNNVNSTIETDLPHTDQWTKWKDTLPLTSNYESLIDWFVNHEVESRQMTPRLLAPRCTSNETLAWSANAARRKTTSADPVSVRTHRMLENPVDPRPRYVWRPGGKRLRKQRERKSRCSNGKQPAFRLTPIKTLSKHRVAFQDPLGDERQEFIDQIECEETEEQFKNRIYSQINLASMASDRRREDSNAARYIFKSHLNERTSQARLQHLRHARVRRRLEPCQLGLLPLRDGDEQTREEFDPMTPRQRSSSMDLDDSHEALTPGSTPVATPRAPTSTPRDRVGARLQRHSVRLNPLDLNIGLQSRGGYSIPSFMFRLLEHQYNRMEQENQISTDHLAEEVGPLVVSSAIPRYTGPCSSACYQSMSELSFHQAYTADYFTCHVPPKSRMRARKEQVQKGYTSLDRCFDRTIFSSELPMAMDGWQAQSTVYESENVVPLPDMCLTRGETNADWPGRTDDLIADESWINNLARYSHSAKELENTDRLIENTPLHQEVPSGNSKQAMDSNKDSIEPQQFLTLIPLRQASSPNLRRSVLSGNNNNRLNCTRQTSQIMIQSPVQLTNESSWNGNWIPKVPPLSHTTRNRLSTHGAVLLRESSKQNLMLQRSKTDVPVTATLQPDTVTPAFASSRSKHRHVAQKTITYPMVRQRSPGPPPPTPSVGQ